jgi:hypothetical protein
MKDFIVIKKGRKSKQADGQVRIKFSKSRAIIHFYNGTARKISNSGYILMKYACDENRLYFERASDNADAYKITCSSRQKILDGWITTSSKILEWVLLEGVYTLEYDSTEQLYYIQFDVEASRILNNREI